MKGDEINEQDIEKNKFLAKSLVKTKNQNQFGGIIYAIDGKNEADHCNEHFGQGLREYQDPVYNFEQTKKHC